MWISRKDYESLTKLKATQKQIELAAPVLGKYFIAVKSENYWSIIRIDKTIKQIPYAAIMYCHSELAAQIIVAHFDKEFERLLELKPKSTSTDLLLWLANAHKMAKRVWDCKPSLVNKDMEYFQIKDGAIPMWWINQELERVVKGQKIEVNKNVVE